MLSGAPDYRPAQTWSSRSLFAALGFRRPAAEHTRAEGELLRRCARGRRIVVELGVAEGGSAWELRQEMHPEGTLYLVDPYHLSRLGKLSPTRMTARRLVGSVRNASVSWIEQLSHDAVRGWDKAIDFLFIDGDHSFDAVDRDWRDWTPHLAPRGLVALHDATLDAPWTNPTDGPVRLMERLAEDPAWRTVTTADSIAVLERA
jgi:predicted O-methyltransferase YrrM